MEKVKKVSFSLFIFATAVIFFLAPIDTDLGWHLRYGNYFLENGRPMMENKLTVLLHNQTWPNSYTLYQPLIAFLYGHFGLWGLSLFNSTILVASFYFIWKLFNKNLAKASIIALINTVGGWTILRYGLRGQITSMLFLTILFYILEKVKQPKNITAGLGILFLFWSNFHGSYLYGILLAGLWTLLNLKPLIIIPSLFTPLINPYGLGNYKHVLTTMTSPLNQMIAEWTQPRPIYKLTAVGLFIFYLAVWQKNKKKITSKTFFWPLATLSSLYLLFKARRNLPQFFLIQSTAFLKILNFDNLKPSLLNILWGTTAVLGMILILPRTFQLNSDWSTYCQQGMTKYPYKAVNYIKEKQLTGNIFNFYRWGGFLTWQLPENLIFVAGHIPGRPTPDGKYPYKIHLNILQAQPGYQEKLNKYDINYILIPSGTFLDLELQKNETAPWLEIYRDKISVLYKKVH